MSIIYFFIAFIATILGAVAGLGGGVIIKPLLDILGNYDVSTISVLSSCTVLSMAIVSIIKQIRYKFKLEIRKTVFIGIGSIFGGVIGENLLKLIINIVSNNTLIKIIQNSILAILLLFVYIYMNNKDKFKRYNLKKDVYCLLVGVALGLISSFLSIGGGPINVCVLTLCFSMTPKEAAVNSIITILFSQSSKIITISLTTGFSHLNLSMLPLMIIGGILGGLLGSRLNKIFNNDLILKIFNTVIVSLIILNIYNVISVYK